MRRRIHSHLHDPNAEYDTSWLRCRYCDRALVRFHTKVYPPSAPDREVYGAGWKVLQETPYCAYQTAHERGEEVR